MSAATAPERLALREMEPAKLYQGVLGTSITALYTAKKLTEIRGLILANYSSASATVDITHADDGAADAINQRVLDDYAIPAKTVVFISFDESEWVLDATDVIRGLASAATSIHCIISGGKQR